jgi:hypothetical protein
MNKRGIATILILPLMVLALVAYRSVTRPESGSPFAYPTFTPSPLSGDNQEAAYVAAQATLASGQSEMMELSHQATVVSLNMDQAADAAAQATMDYHQRQLMELSIQGTEVSQNMARAAATQQFISEQTQMVWNATATAQSQAATATYSAYILHVTQTAQAQAKATLTAYSLTATPWAAIQADILRTRNERERRAWWEEFVVNPLKAILFTLVVVLLIVGGVMAYRRPMPVLELRLRTITRGNDSPLLLVDGMIVDPYPPHRRLTRWVQRQPNLPQLPSDETPHVEIIGPSEPSVTNWITEAEWKLRADGWIQP